MIEVAFMKVMLVYPNDRMDGLISTNISVLSSHLKSAGHEVQLYDTTFTDTGKKTGDFYREELGQVIKTDLTAKGVVRKKMSLREIQEDFKKTVLEYNPGLVGFSVLEITYDQGLYLAQAIEEIKVPIIFGGIYPSFAPRIVLREPAIDMICEGEGEMMLPELATALENGDDIKPILNLTVKHTDGKIYRSGQEIALDDLPTGDDFRGEKTGLRRPQTHMENELLSPDYSIYGDNRFWKKMFGRAVRAVAMELSRGCPYTCAFCCVPMQQQQHRAAKKLFSEFSGGNSVNAKIADPYHREKSIEKFINEVKSARDDFGIEFIYFTDESFLSMTRKRFDLFIEGYRKVGLPFFIETRVETVREGYAEALEGVGCAGVAMGVESGSLELRKSLLSRLMADDVIVRGFREFEKTNIRISANNIIGFPSETREDIMRTIEINRSIRPDSIVVNAFRPYSGTPLRQKCIEMGLIPKEERAEDNRVYGAFFNGVLPSEELEGIRRAFNLYVKFPKDRWDEVRAAERDNKAFEYLIEEFLSKDMLHRKTLPEGSATAEEIFLHD